jgi:hypothetical protein
MEQGDGFHEHMLLFEYRKSSRLEIHRLTEEGLQVRMVLPTSFLYPAGIGFMLVLHML